MMMFLMIIQMVFSISGDIPDDNHNILMALFWNFLLMIFNFPQMFFIFSLNEIIQIHVIICDCKIDKFRMFW